MAKLFFDKITCFLLGLFFAIITPAPALADTPKVTSSPKYGEWTPYRANDAMRDVPYSGFVGQDGYEYKFGRSVKDKGRSCIMTMNFPTGTEFVNTCDTSVIAFYCPSKHMKMERVPFSTEMASYPHCRFEGNPPFLSAKFGGFLKDRKLDSVGLGRLISRNEYKNAYLITCDDTRSLLPLPQSGYVPPSAPKVIFDGYSCLYATRIVDKQRPNVSDKPKQLAILTNWDGPMTESYARLARGGQLPSMVRKLAEGESGRVVYELSVTSNGKVSACFIAESSGSLSTDVSICRKAYRITFQPARNSKNNPVPSTVKEAFVYKRIGKTKFNIKRVVY